MKLVHCVIIQAGAVPALIITGEHESPHSISKASLEILFELTLIANENKCLNRSMNKQPRGHVIKVTNHLLLLIFSKQPQVIN